MVDFMQTLMLSMFVVDFAYGNEYFSIIGPQSVQFGEDLEVFLSSTHFSEPANLEVSLWTQKPRTELEKFVFKLPAKSQKVVFNLRAQQNRQNYTLLAGIPSKNIARNTNIYTSECDYTVLLQTDKNVYKANEKVNFRILVIDADLKPYQMKKMLVSISDANKNVVVRKTSIFISNGATEDYFMLSDDAITGKWEIKVQIDNEERKTRKSFEVKTYHATGFEAIIETRPIVYISDEIMNVTVYAKYIFDHREKLVRGKAKIKIEVLRGGLEPYNVFRNVAVEEKTSSILHLRNDLNIEDSEAIIQISMIFEEALSNIQISTEKVVAVKPKTKQFEISRDEFFKPGLPYILDVVVKDRNGSLIQNAGSLISITVVYYNDFDCNAISESNKFIFEGAVDHLSSIIINESSRFIIPTQIQNSAMHITIKCSDSVQNVNVFRAASKTRRYIEAKILTERLKENHAIRVKVTGSEDFESLNVVVLSGHRIMFSDTFKGIKTNPFMFDLPSYLVADAVMFVYYHEPLGEIIYDRIKLKIEEDTSNSVEVSLSKNQVKPGDKITFTIKSPSNSTVYLSVSESATLSVVENQLQQGENLLKELLRQFNQPNFEQTKKTRYPHFTDSNTFVLTNADKGKYECSISRMGLDLSDAVTLSNNEDTGNQTSRVRSDFSNAWLFQSFNVQANKLLMIERNVPDLITNWTISGFSINYQSGFNTVKPLTLSVFKHFFINVRLPDTINLHEIFRIEVSIFNYGENGKSTVTLYNDDGNFERVEKCNFDTTNTSTRKRFKINKILRTKETEVFFYVRPITVGKLNLRFKAKLGEITDETHHELIVKRTGVATSISKNFLIDLRNHNEFIKIVQLNLSQLKAVQGSVEIVASLKGNILGSLLQPGMGKINKVQQFMSTIYQMDYLNTVGKLTFERRSEKLQTLKITYQNLIRTRDLTVGSFADGCVWMTAYAANCLGKARAWMEIEEDVLFQALEFLKNQQNVDGGFKKGENRHENLALTAFVAIAFMENINFLDSSNQINQAINFLKRELKHSQNNYDLAITTYALACNKDPSVQEFINVLELNSVTEGDEKFWKTDIIEATRCSSCLPEDVKVEIASYSLLAFLAVNDTMKALPVLKWLIGNMDSNRHSVFSKTTITALHAVKEAAKTFHSKNFSMDGRINNDKGYQIHRVKINHETSVEQTVKVSTVSDEISVNVTGHGIAAFEITLKYISNFEVNSNKFNVNITAKKLGELSTLEACAFFIFNESQFHWTSAVMELTLPSGYELYPSSSILMESSNIKKLESRADVNIYIEKLNASGICYELNLIKKIAVTEKSPSFVKVFDFYQPDQYAVKLYNLDNDENQEEDCSRDTEGPDNEL